MKAPSPSARRYRWLGYLALAHALAIFAVGFLLFSGESGLVNAWRLRLWIAISTLWFLWPIALALHSGRSLLRGALFISVGVLLLLPSLRLFNLIAPETFGLPMGVSMNPLSVWQYYSAHRAGEAQARKEIAAGILAIEEFGFGAGGDSHVRRILSERFQIELRATAGCVVDEKILGHANGYNGVMTPEIDRRFGQHRVEAAREEGYQLERARSDR